MKIAICLRTWGEQGGIGGYTRNLLKHLLPLESGHEFVLLYCDAAHLGQFAHYPNVREVHVASTSRGTWDQIAVPYRAAKEGVDVIFHTKFAVPLFTGRKTVMVLHGSERFVYPQFSHRGDILFFKTIYPLYLRRASAIVSVSENARKDVIRHLDLDPDKLKTVHLAASEDFHPVTDQNRLEAVRRKYHLSQRFILNVGLIYPGKNLANLFRALKLVRRYDDVRLVVAGSGRRMYARDLAEVRELGLEDAVQFTGYIPHEDLPAVYSLAETVAFPSFYESFPAIPLEAQACGCPVVISDTGGSPEAAGHAARYVDPWVPGDIADGILDVLMKPGVRQGLIARGFDNVKRFSWQQTARRTLDVLESLA